MKKLVALLLSATMMMSLLTACGSKEETEVPVGERTEPLVLTLGQLGSGRENDMMTYSSTAFMEYIENETNGMITFEFFPDSQLGGEADMMDQVIAGSLDVAPLSSNVLSTVWPEFAVLNLPFAFPSMESYFEIIDSPEVHTELQRVVDGSGKAVYLGAGFIDFRGCQNSKLELREPEDFKGITFRVMAGEIFTDIFRGLGASTSTVAFGELYTGLQQGVVDAEDVSAAMFYDQKFYEVEKFHTSFNMVASANPYVVSPSTWAKLTEEEKEIFYEAVKIGGAASTAKENTYIEEVYGLLEEQGVKITRFTDLTKEEVDACRTAMEPVWEKYTKGVDEQFLKVFTEVRDANIA